jgi:uncharacterized repeat protein (TIGR01451 family)
MTLMVGGTYTIVLDGFTATNGYNQLESFINFKNTVFRVLSASTTYTAEDSPYVDNPNTRLYADACGWENDPSSPNYRSCVGGDYKAGGTVVMTYTIKVIGGGGTQETLSSLLYDFSGSSYHYNGDHDVSPRVVNIVDPTNVTMSKNFSPDPTNVNGVSALTITISNPNPGPVSGFNFTDPLPTIAGPGTMKVADPPAAATSGCGSPTFAPLANDTTLTFSNGTVAANSSCVIKVNVTTDLVGTYTNTTNHLYVDTLDTGEYGTDTLTVNNAPAPGVPICNVTMAQWTFTGYSGISPPFPAATTQESDVGTAAITVGNGLSAEADATDGNPAAPSIQLYGWLKNDPINTATSPWVQFAIDTSNYTDVEMQFNANRTNAGPPNCALYYSTNGTNWTQKSTFAPGTSWATFGPYDFTGQTSTTSVTYFRVYGNGANNPNKGADLNLDNVTFFGCHVAEHATISKAFAVDPIQVDGTTTLTFTLTNPNSAQLTGAKFTDDLPSGLQVAAPPNASTTCGGSPSWSPTAGSTSLQFGQTTGATIPGTGSGGSCTVSVNVTATTAGPHYNTSGFLSTTESGTNTSSVASDSLTAVSPPEISKQFDPNPILEGGTSTLTFLITNPNQNEGLSSVAFSDTFPTSPGAMVVAATPNATTDCGGTVTATAGAGSVSFSGGTISGGGTCIVTVDVTAPTAGDYANTSGNVSHVVNSATVNGNTASDTLTVTPVHPSISLSKMVGTSASGPWTKSLTVAPGGDVYYQFTVENTGDVPLTSVSVSDPDLAGTSVDPAGCTWDNPLPVGTTTVDPTDTCVKGPISAVAGVNTNTATAEGTYSSTAYQSDPSSAEYLGVNSVSGGAVTLEKQISTSADGPWTSALTGLPGGTKVYYKFTVINNGTLDLSSVSVDDPDVNTSGCTFSDPLADGSSTICIVGPITTNTSGGTYTNTAHAHGVNGGTTYTSANDSASYAVSTADRNFGHLPSSYTNMNLLADGGASHLTDASGVFLGATVPTESDGTNNATYSDEATDDGVTWTSGVTWINGPNGGSVDVTVHCPTPSNPPYYLNAWIDWNDNDSFEDPGDHIFVNREVVCGTQTLTFTIPDTASLTGTFYARFRLYSELPSADPEPNGTAMNRDGDAATYGEVEDYVFVGQGGQMTPVTLAYFFAQRKDGGVHFEWSTATETGNLGFNVYVQVGDKLVQVNEELIPSRQSDSLSRQGYAFDAAPAGEVLYVEDVSVSGGTRRYGPFRLGTEYGWLPKDGAGEWAPTQDKEGVPPVNPPDASRDSLSSPGAAPDTEATVRVGPQGPPILNLKVRRTGIYRVTYEMLKDAGLEVAGVPFRGLTLTNRGRQIPIYVRRRQGERGPSAGIDSSAKDGDGFGPGAFIEFYGEALDTIYMDTNIYTLHTGLRDAPRIASAGASPESDVTPVASYTETVQVNNQRRYSYTAPGDDGWYDASMLVYKVAKSWDFPFQLSDLTDPSAPGSLELVVWGITNWPRNPDHHLVASLNGVVVTDEKFDGHAVRTLKLTLPPGALQEGANTLRLTLPGDTGVKYDMVNLDKFSVSFQRRFTAQRGRLDFTAAGSVFQVAGLPSADVVVYRLAEQGPVRLANVQVKASGKTFTAGFAGAAQPSAYVVAAAEALNVPELETPRLAANLDRPAEYLIISHPDFIDGLQPLVNARKAQGLTVGVVDVTGLYARYTDGIFDPQAIKQHIAFAAKSLGAKYILLVGGDTFDYRGYLGTKSTSFIPSLYAPSGVVSFLPADPLYADLNSDNVPDLAIGRFPVRTKAELETMIQKTLAYSRKDYGRTALFAADKFDGRVSYKAISDALAGSLPADWPVKKAYLDDTSVNEAFVQLNNEMNKGTAMVTFTGHSGPSVWTFNNLFNAQHAAALTNAGRPFVAVQWGCWNTYYVDPVKNSLMSGLLLSGDRGAAAVFGATTLTSYRSEELLAKLLTPRLVTPGMTIGQAMQEAKLELAQSRPELVDVMLGWTLLGDPALTIEP